MTEQEHHSTKPEDRVSLIQRLGIGVGGFPAFTGGLCVQTLAQPIFQIVMGLNPVLFGVAMTIPRLLDAFTDPLIGRWSDRSASRFGRRRPFIFVGSIVMAITFALIWFASPSWGNVALFLWLTTTSILFYLAYAIFVVPLTSLTYEVTPDYHERTRFMAFWATFSMIAGLVMNFYAPAAQWEGFGSPVIGTRWVALGISVVVFAGLGIIPAMVAKERFGTRRSSDTEIGFIEAIRQAVSSKPLLLLIAVIFALNFCGTIAGSLAQYVVIYHVLDGDIKAGIALNALNGVCYSIIGFITIPLTAWIGTRIGKRRTVQLALVLSSLGGIGKWVLVTPSHPYLLLFDSLLSGPLWATIGVLIPSMMADLCDYDELEHGERREGVIGAVFAWITKVGLSFTFLFSGLVLQFSGFDQSIKLQSPHTITIMRLFFAGASFAAPIFAIICLHYYSITEARAYEIRSLLERRRGVL